MKLEGYLHRRWSRYSLMRLVAVFLFACEFMVNLRTFFSGCGKRMACARGRKIFKQQNIALR